MAKMEIKALIIFALGFLSCCEADDFHCSPIQSVSTDYSSPVCYIKKCTIKIEKHIEEELHAAFYYMYMAAHFDQDIVNRPGLAKFLYESASEERQHAIMMLDYLNTRGISFNESYTLRQSEINVPDYLTYKNALETALNMEIRVTKAIHSIIEECVDDFHGADVFTGQVMEEQHSGIRKIQGLLKTYDDMVLGSSDTNAVALAEFLFDKKLI